MCIIAPPVAGEGAGKPAPHISHRFSSIPPAGLIFKEKARMTDQPDDPILSGYEARIAALEALKAAYLQAKALGAIGPTGEGVSAVSLGGTLAPARLPKGAFLGKSVPDAIILYLESERENKTIQQIASALAQNGVKSSGTLSGVVTSALHRLKRLSPPKVLQFNDGWGLPDWLPPHLAARIGNGEAAPKKRTPAKRRAGKQRGTAAANSDRNTDGGPLARLKAAFSEDPGGVFTKQEIAARVPTEKPQTLGLLLARLCHEKFLRVSDGGYRLNV